jgi:mannitol-specific phosphotransferase system IIBC component
LIFFLFVNHYKKVGGIHALFFPFLPFVGIFVFWIFLVGAWVGGLVGCIVGGNVGSGVIGGLVTGSIVAGAVVIGTGVTGAGVIGGPLSSALRSDAQKMRTTKRVDATLIFWSKMRRIQQSESQIMRI